MTGRKFRRKVRKRKGAVGNSRMKFGLFFGIIALTVGLGFLTARFAIGPLIGFHAEKEPHSGACGAKGNRGAAKADCRGGGRSLRQNNGGRTNRRKEAREAPRRKRRREQTENGGSTQAGYAVAIWRVFVESCRAESV